MLQCWSEGKSLLLFTVINDHADTLDELQVGAVDKVAKQQVRVCVHAQSSRTACACGE